VGQKISKHDKKISTPHAITVKEFGFPNSIRIKLNC